MERLARHDPSRRRKIMRENTLSEIAISFKTMLAYEDDGYDVVAKPKIIRPGM